MCAPAWAWAMAVLARAAQRLACFGGRVALRGAELGERVDQRGDRRLG
jgi:hypothetical protein